MRSSDLDATTFRRLRFFRIGENAHCLFRRKNEWGIGVLRPVRDAAIAKQIHIALNQSQANCSRLFAVW